MDSNSMKPIMVLSGINLFEGGPLSIYYDCLDSIISERLNEKFQIIAYVHKVDLFNRYLESNIEFVEIPRSRKSYIFRFYYEYMFFYSVSKKMDVDIWISLHDITPNVKAKYLYTYCHNPSPFRTISFFDFKMGIKNVMFPLFYKWIYRINIRKATGIIVQGQWLRDEFIKLYKISNVIVARPSIPNSDLVLSNNITSGETKLSFIYAAYPRVFKNYQVICNAARFISNKDVLFYLTLDGTENKYSRYIKKHYSDLNNIKWLGLLPRKELFDLYKKVDYLVFPSKMETWGLPITEFENTGKGIFVADLPYAHETVGNYDKVCYFNPDDPSELANKINSVIDGEDVFTKNIELDVELPYAKNWKELLTLLTNRVIDGAIE